MIEAIHFDAGHVVGFRIAGKLDAAIFEEINAQLRRALAHHDKVRLYAEMPSFEGMTFEALLQDLKLGLQHWRDIEREAVVTDERWARTMTSVADALFPGIEVRAFASAEREAARAWIVG